MDARRLRIARAVALAWALAGLASPGLAGPFTGDLSVVIGGLPPIGISGGGSGSSAASGVTLPASAFATTAATAPGSPFITRVILTAANGAGAFAGATLHGPMAIRGRARLMNGGVTAFSIPLTLSSTRGVGLGGAPIRLGTSSSAITLSAGTWSAGLVRVTGVGTSGSPRTVSFAGSDQRTPLGAGSLSLVTPMRISHLSLGTLAAFGVLRLTFVPEPAAAVLLLAATALLGLGARRARRLG
jgi:hypothetical protein